MLIPTRKVGETVVIGEDVRVTVIGTSARSILIGVQAPRSVPVLRQETCKRIERQRRAPATPVDCIRHDD
jgi:carbon storage regulator